MMNPVQLLQMFTQFKQNPMALLGNRFNIPNNINDPQAIIQHLLNSNQISQQQLNQAMSMRNDPQFRNLFR